MTALTPATTKVGPDYSPPPNMKMAGSDVNIINKVPQVAQRLHALDDIIAECDAAGEAGYIAFQRARVAYDEAQTELAILRSKDGAHPSSVAAAQGAVADKRRRLDKAGDLGGPHLTRKAAAAAARDAALKLLSPAGEIAVVDAKSLGSDAKAVEKAKTAVLTLKGQRELTAKAPIPLEDAIGVATDQVLAVAEGIKVGVGGTKGPTVRWPTEMVNAAASLPGVLPTVVDTAALVAHYLCDALVADVTAQLTNAYKHIPLTLDPSDKRQRLAKLDTELGQAERVEAATIWAAADAGVPAEWRADISPLALLGIKVVKTAEEVARDRGYDTGSLMAVGGEAWEARNLG